jgi:uncharacterized membrane protein
VNLNAQRFRVAKLLATIVIVAGLTMRCGSGAAPPVESGGPTADGMEAPVAAAGALAAYAFECDDEQKFVLSRVPGKPDTMDLTLGNRRQRLTRVRAGSGAQYATEGVSVWTKGREAMLEVSGRVTTCREDRRRSIVEDARARGVQLRAAGNEPGWVLELLPDRMIFIGAYGAQRVTTSRAEGASTATQEGTVYTGIAGSHRLTAHVLPGPCFDPMSGDQFESNVEVELDGKTYRGCGEALR